MFPEHAQNLASSNGVNMLTWVIRTPVSMKKKKEKNTSSDTSTRMAKELTNDVNVNTLS